MSFLIMWGLFLYRGNISPSLAAIEAFGDSMPAPVSIDDPSPPGLPSPEQWGPGDAARMTFRHHMPMLFIGGQEDWRPSPTVLATPLGDVRNGWIAAEDYAGLISLVAWLWWALLLLSVTGVIRRVGLRS